MSTTTFKLDIRLSSKFHNKVVIPRHDFRYKMTWEFSDKIFSKIGKVT